MRRLSPPGGSLAKGAQEAVILPMCEISRAWQFSNKISPLVKLETAFLRQASPCMALENPCVPDVISQRVHALAPRLIGRLQRRRVLQRWSGSLIATSDQQIAWDQVRRVGRGPASAAWGAQAKPAWQ